MAITSNALLPLVYWYGHGSIGKNPLLFERLIRNLGHVMDDKWDLDAEGTAWSTPEYLPRRTHLIIS